MSQTLKSILGDYEFWLIFVALIGFVADATAEGKLTIFRFITILFMAALVLSYVIRKLNLQKEKQVPFLVVVGKEDSQYRDTLGQVETALHYYGLNVQRLEKTFGLLHEDWIFHLEPHLPTEPASWKETILKIERKFWRLAERIPGRKVYHIFMNGPSTLALALGATIGSRSEFAFYHYQPGTGTNPYHAVVDFSADVIPEGPHILKSRLSQLEFINISGMKELKQSKQTEALIAIYLAGHNPIPDVQKRGEETGLPVVTIASKFKGTIPLNNDWLRIAREVSTALYQVLDHRNIERLHLFLSTPLAIAFCLGTALGKFVRANVYNYFPNPGKYFEVFRMEEL